jgi:hypothetical protein
MVGWVIVQEHPYYAVTDGNGKFSLGDVPPGEYTLRIWHEILGEKRQPITVKAKDVTLVEVELGQ